MGRARRAWAASTLLQPTVGCGEKAEKPASAGRPGRVSALPGCGARLESATPQERTRRPGIEQRAQQRAPGAGPGAVSEACATDTRQIWAGRTGLGKIKGWSCTEPARPETTQGAPEPASRPVVLGGTDTAAGTPPAHVAPRERLPNDRTEGQPGLSRFPCRQPLASLPWRPLLPPVAPSVGQSPSPPREEPVSMQLQVSALGRASRSPDKTTPAKADLGRLRAALLRAHACVVCAEPEPG